MEINKNTVMPLFYQIKENLKAKILSGDWEVGQQIPTEKELAAQFKVSTITVKRAVHELVAEGMLYRRSGKGTFVIRQEEQSLSKLVTLKNEAWEDHHHPHNLIRFTIDKTEQGVRPKLELNGNEKVYSIHRVKTENDIPLAIEFSYLPVSPFPDLTIEMLENQLLYNLITEHYQIELGKAKVYFSSIAATQYEAELLQVPLGEHLLMLERCTAAKDGRILEYSKFILKDTQSKYFLEIEL
ncbi:GntR family transcriptional regulator [Edaphobacillus lindanitolerans]|uniref:GntR family transcriptional regulator n=1 Tax=Edaphobacillus lindanitolerans TaxID=550447 RepID=UPI00097789B7|nr:GntR family transcriptional regulator [Edaphobacillus lindanitolerans]